MINGGLFHSLQNLSSTWHSADLKTFGIFYLQYMQMKVGRTLIHGISFRAQLMNLTSSGTSELNVGHGFVLMKVCLLGDLGQQL
jgi:hypothetical protein